MSPKITHRPWGHYTILEEGPNYKVKRIHVDPQARLSLQLHQYRTEHWVVVAGIARITIGDKTFDASPNDSTYIPVKTMHRLENRGETPVELIEVQCGNYLGEDDIIRLDDDYKRHQT